VAGVRGHRRIAARYRAPRRLAHLAAQAITRGQPVPVRPPSPGLDGHLDRALSARQRLVLHSIAADMWKFYAADVDPNTNLPLDNLGP
jgi:hypothetical protein